MLGNAFELQSLVLDLSIATDLWLQKINLQPEKTKTKLFNNFRSEPLSKYSLGPILLLRTLVCLTSPTFKNRNIMRMTPIRTSCDGKYGQIAIIIIISFSWRWFYNTYLKSQRSEAAMARNELTKHDGKGKFPCLSTSSLQEPAHPRRPRGGQSGREKRREKSVMHVK